VSSFRQEAYKYFSVFQWQYFVDHEVDEHRRIVHTVVPGLLKPEVAFCWSACFGEPSLGDGGYAAVVVCSIDHHKGTLELICFLFEAAMPELQVDFFHSLHQASDQIDSIGERVLRGVVAVGVETRKHCMVGIPVTDEVPFFVQLFVGGQADGLRFFDCFGIAPFFCSLQDHVVADCVVLG